MQNQPPYILTPPIPDGIGKATRWFNLQGCSQALAIMQAARSAQRAIVLVVDDTASARRLDYELRLFNDPLALVPVMIFPDWETLPYDRFSAHQDIISERLAILSRLPHLSQGIVIVPVATLMHRMIPASHLKNSFVMQQGESVDTVELAKRLESQGYHRVPQVMAHAEFSIRGSIIDLYPAGARTPYRIDLFDDEIDSICAFDTETQRSVSEKMQEILLLPAYEMPLDAEGIGHFRQAWCARFPGNPKQVPFYQSVLAGQYAAGIEYYLPLFFDELSTLFEYMPSDGLIITQAQVHQHAEGFWQNVQARYEQYQHDVSRPILAPVEFLMTVDQLFGQLKSYPLVQIQDTRSALPSEHTKEQVIFSTRALPSIDIDHRAKKPLIKLQALIDQSAGRTLICAETPGRQESLCHLLAEIDIRPTLYQTWQEFLKDTAPIGSIIAPMDTGCVLQGLTSQISDTIHIISEVALFGQQVMQRRRRKAHGAYQADAMVQNLVELSVGDRVVHVNHGIGCYQGLEVIEAGGTSAEYLCIEYAEKNKLYVPIASLHLISRYTGGDVDHVPLSRLGSKRWDRAKRKAMERVHDVAAQLLEIYAKRQAQLGLSFTLVENDYAAFADAFPFETTPDQQRAIDETLQDMCSKKPMDRLICGDVGFGKTEVAMRAAFLATDNHKQVLVLVPTTLLATQHARSFSDRLAHWPVHVDYISRLRTPKEQKTVLAAFQSGKLDILIGTHRLLNKDMPLDNVGLLIIDEEHRFGVAQKERIKSMRTQIDILSLTATPIPRTLNMTLLHLRDISIIATPPMKRLAIKTFIHEYDKGLIKEAIQRELLRGGQVYFMHNRVESIEQVATELAELLPEATIAVGHGQMPERALEQVMADFYRQRYNILVCTTIVESGIDIPTANTIIINRADRLGLAQLHQIRGRVGRSHRQAYAYLLVPPKKAMTPDALKRLKAIASLENLGAGFMLANHDLEIRGAGELLSDEQSGHIHSIGFSLYVELLNQAIESLREGKALSLESHHAEDIDINVGVSALLPDTYIADVHTRLILYKRIAATTQMSELADLRAEIIDRFGLLPEPAKTLLEITAIKWQAMKLGVTSMQFDENGGIISFAENTPIPPEKMITLIQSQPSVYRLKGSHKLQVIQPALGALDQRLDGIHQLLKMLGEQD